NKVGEIVDTYPQVIDDLSVVTKELKVEEFLALAEHIDELAPEVLLTVEAVRQTVDEVNEQVIPVVVQESTQLREEVPGILNQATELVDKSKVLAQTATQGAVEGTVKGVVLSPINLIRDAGNGIKTRVQGEEEVPAAE
ncbi:hypothetical protein QTO02_20765, partial [Vibrio fortis]